MVETIADRSRSERIHTDQLLEAKLLIDDCPHHQQSHRRVRKIKNLAGKLLNFKSYNQKLQEDLGSRLSRQFLDCPDSFWIVRTVFRLSRLQTDMN